MRRMLGVSWMGLVVAGPLAGQAPLPIGSRAQNVTTLESPARFAFTPSSAGVLTVVVRATDDVGIRFLDADRQLLPDGTVDGDQHGNMGLEFGAIAIGHAEPMLVEVHRLSDDGGDGQFTITATFIAEAAFARPVDPDRRPSQARRIAPGQALDESLNPDAGDGWDWYAVTADQAMTIVIVTRTTDADQGDLTIDAYVGDDYESATVSSDQDLQENPGNESVTVDLGAGQTVRFRVNALFGSGGMIPYRVSVGKVP